MSLSDYPLISFHSSAFARYTLDVRLPTLIGEIIDSGIFDREVGKELRKFAGNLPLHRVQVPRLMENEKIYWEKFLKDFDRRALIDVPFFPAEIYFYRHLLDLTRFFENQIDPFGFKKEKELSIQIPTFLSLLTATKNFDLRAALVTALAGNKADLSLLQRQNQNAALDLIADDTDRMIEAIESSDTVHILLDNAGLELFTDLILTRAILNRCDNVSVILWPKSYPIFVSDTTRQDILIMLDALEQSDDPLLSDFGHEIKDLLHSGRIKFEEHIFWNTPQYFNQLSQELQDKIQTDDVFISKGDANYRRFFEDRHVPADYSGAAKITDEQYALRTMKSEIIAGITPEKANELSSEDPHWMTNGKYGIIQKLV